MRPGVHALVLQLVEGPTLADRISQGAMPIDEALPIARQIAEALRIRRWHPNDRRLRRVDVRHEHDAVSCRDAEERDEADHRGNAQDSVGLGLSAGQCTHARFTDRH
jgi:hypothetical protein